MARRLTSLPRAEGASRSRQMTAGRFATTRRLTPPSVRHGPLYVNGGNGCYRTDLLRSLGGFPAYDAEDAALGARARAAGLRYVYVPSATVQHRNPEGWQAYARNARKVGRYAAQFDTGPWRARLIRTRLRMVGGALKPAMRGDFFESVALLTRALAGGVGVIDVRRSHEV